jgi:hypothetical protein
MPNTSFETWCCIDCALVIARTKQERKEKKQRALMKQKEKLDRAIMRVKKEKLKTISELLKRARETAFQVWVKKRDFKWFEENGLDPACIMCGNKNPKSWHACHFQSVGSKPELQFHPANCNLGCGQCNFFANQSDTEYENNMVVKYGKEMVEYLKNYNATCRWDREEIEDIRQHFKSETRRIENE